MTKTTEQTIFNEESVTKGGLDDVLQGMRKVVVERGGCDGFMSHGDLDPNMQRRVDRLMQLYRDSIDDTSTKLYLFDKNVVEFRPNIDPNDSLAASDDAVSAGLTNVLAKSFQGRKPGDLQRAHILVADYKGDKENGLYLRYVEETAMCTAGRSNYFELGAFVNPSDISEIAHEGSSTGIDVRGSDELRLYGCSSDESSSDKIIRDIFESTTKNSN